VCSYPVKIPRTEGFPLRNSEHDLPSSISSPQYLTSDEIEDNILLVAFLRERWRENWPNSFWAAFWSVYRAIYLVSLQLVLIFYIDYLWTQKTQWEVLDKLFNTTITTASSSSTTAASTASTQDSGAVGHHSNERRIGAGQEGVGNGRLIIAGILGLLVLTAHWLFSFTNNWILLNVRPGGNAKALRDCMVTQLLWADNGRLGIMRVSDYLTAATSEVNFLPINHYADVLHLPRFCVCMSMFK